jgi:beta-ribofuranosylaminobenzene 5'-phosphate synthase
MTPQAVHIQTGCRLHFGPLSHHPEKGRHFGGIGMMIQSPGFDLVIKKSETTSASNSELALALLDMIRSNHPEWDQPVSLEVTKEIPTHQGLGSGTQLGMAVTEAVGLLHGESGLTAQQLASHSRRGQRSAIGLHGYLEGGFLIDAGHQQEESIGQIACRLDFPEEWIIMLVTPNEVQGVHGEDETQSFAKLSPMSQSRTGELSRLALTEILPSVKYTDFRAFALAIREYGEIVGDFFAPIQGGLFSHAEMNGFADRLHKENVNAIAQSSWGPTVAIFVPDQVEADRVSALVREDELGQKCLLTQTQPMNTGRTLTME